MRKFLFLPFILSIAAVSFLTGCSDSSSDNNTLPVTIVTPIDSSDINTFTGTYKGVSMRGSNLAVHANRAFLDFEAKAVLNKPENDENKIVEITYNMQFSDYNIDNRINNINTNKLNININDINVNKNQITFDISSDNNSYSVTLEKESDTVETIEDKPLWTRKALCNATSQDISTAGKCNKATEDGALRFVGSYRIKSIQFDNCSNSAVGGTDVIGEMTANPTMSGDVFLPITLKFQINKSWLDNNTSCISNENLYYYNKSEDTIDIASSNKYKNDGSLDLNKVFKEVGLVAHTDTYSDKFITYYPKKQNKDTLEFTDLQIFGKTAIIEIELIKSPVSVTLLSNGGSDVKSLSETPYWK